ncbi:helix-turn-helix domain-containing protein [Streptomyces sp. NPDC008125]|uniref:helix-turn-helix domain-containing protein n=1 Tax=Streptomyces sp. NPDC008125 TaxID=3364811 RepID=UPI0036E83828
MTETVISGMLKNAYVSEKEPAGDAGFGHPRDLPWPAVAGETECLYVGLCVKRSKTVFHRGVARELDSGDLVVAVGARGELPFDQDFAVFRISFDFLGVSRRSLHRLAETHVSGGSGIASLVSQFLGALVGEEFRHSEINRRLAVNAVDLIAALVGELVEDDDSDEELVREQILGRIKAYIVENLMDPGMSPESIARAHYISVRYLHKMFQGEGVTVSSLIRELRLDACRRELRMSLNRRRTVAAVAQSWGFVSSSHFSRVFRQAYGVSPREWQSSGREA